MTFFRFGGKFAASRFWREPCGVTVWGYGVAWPVVKLFLTNDGLASTRSIRC